MKTDVSKGGFFSPYDHVRYLVRDGGLVLYVTGGKSPQYHAVLKAGPIWAYLCHCDRNGTPKPSRTVHGPRWHRWEDIEDGVGFITI